MDPRDARFNRSFTSVRTSNLKPRTSLSFRLFQIHTKNFFVSFASLCSKLSRPFPLFSAPRQSRRFHFGLLLDAYATMFVFVHAVIRPLFAFVRTLFAYVRDNSRYFYPPGGACRIRSCDDLGLSDSFSLQSTFFQDLSDCFSLFQALHAFFSPCLSGPIRL